MRFTPYEYEKEKRIATTGLIATLVIAVGFLVICTDNINADRQRQIRDRLRNLSSEVNYIKGHQIYNTEILEQINFVEAVGQAVNLEP